MLKLKTELMKAEILVQRGVQIKTTESMIDALVEGVRRDLEYQFAMQRSAFKDQRVHELRLGVTVHAELPEATSC